MDKAEKSLFEINIMREELNAVDDMIKSHERFMGPSGIKTSNFGENRHGENNESTEMQLARLTELLEYRNKKCEELNERMHNVLTIIDRIEQINSRTFLIRHYINGQSYDELTRYYGRSYGTLKRWDKVAVDRFRKKMKENER